MIMPKDLRFTKTHEWVRKEGDVVVVGITDFAQQQLSDLTYIELPEPGDHLDAEDEVGVVESVKAAGDICAPLAGTVTEVNTSLESAPEQVNNDPFGNGWLFKVKPDDMADVERLMDAAHYEDSLPEDE